MKLHALKATTLSKIDSCEIWEILKNTLFYWTSRVAGFVSFMFPACNFVKKKIPAKMLFCEFCKILKTSFYKTPPDDWFLSLSVNFSVYLLSSSVYLWSFQKTSFIEYLWETAYFMHKLKDFNKQIQWKTTSHVLFKPFIHEWEVAIRRSSFT